MLKRTESPKVAVNEQPMGETAPSKQRTIFNTSIKTRSNSIKFQRFTFVGHASLICAPPQMVAMPDRSETKEIRCSTDRGIKIIIQFVGSAPFGLSALLRQLPQHLPDEVCNCSPVDNLFYNFTQLSGKNHNEASNVAAPAMPLRTLTGWKQSTCLQSALHYTCYDGFGCLNFWKWNTLADTFSYELHMTKKWWHLNQTTSLSIGMGSYSNHNVYRFLHACSPDLCVCANSFVKFCTFSKSNFRPHGPHGPHGTKLPRQGGPKSVVCRKPTYQIQATVATGRDGHYRCLAATPSI